MGRGGGRSGGGSFSSGGSRSFSSHRSSSSSINRGGGRSSSRSPSYHSSSRSRPVSPPPRQAPRPRPTPTPPTRPIITSRPVPPPPRRHTVIVREPYVSRPVYTQPTYTKTYTEPKEKRSHVFRNLCIMVVVMVAVLLCIAYSASNRGTNTIQRTKLESNLVTDTGCIIDDKIQWLSSPSTVKEGMDYFYKKTGVQPYLLICDNLDGKGATLTDAEAEDYLEGLYESTYNDEGHMIFTFMEYAESEYVTYLYAGTAASDVMDESARDVFLTTVDRYYTDMSLSDSEYFEKVFRVSADKIMKNTESNQDITKICIILSGLLTMGLVAGLIWTKQKEYKLKQDKISKEILNTPIGSDSETPEEKDLLKKYENKKEI